MSRFTDQGSGDAAFAASYWDSFNSSRFDRARNRPTLLSTTGQTFAGGLKRHRGSQGLVLKSSHTLDSTNAGVYGIIASITVVEPLALFFWIPPLQWGAGPMAEMLWLMGSLYIYSTNAAAVTSAIIDPQFSLSSMWPQQQGGQNPGATYPDASTMHKHVRPSTESAAAAIRSRPCMLQGHQQSAASGNSDGTYMVYAVFRQDRTAVADSCARFNGQAAASAAETQSHIIAKDADEQQQRMLFLRRQQEAAAVQAKQQQLLLAQAQQAQQQQQAALARSAAAAAATGLAGARALYGNYRQRSAGQQQQWDRNAAKYHHQLQQQSKQQLFGLNLQHTSSTSDAAKSTSLALQQLQDQNSGFGSSSSRFASRCSKQASGEAAARARGAGIGHVAWWSGIISAGGTIPGSAESDANTGGFLECNEDLLSLEALDVYNQQPVHPHKPAAVAVQHSTHPCVLQQATKTRGMFDPESMPGYAQDASSTNDSNSDYTMSDDGVEDDQLHAINRRSDPAALGLSVLVSGRAAATAAEEALALEHTVVMQVLGIVAEQRKGAPVLTAAPLYAATAGAQSVRPRLLISEVSVYTENGANSQLALEQANKLLGKMTLPDDIDYMPVSSESFLYRAGAAWQFPAFVVCLGSSYLQRMFARLPQLAEAAFATPGFEDYCQYMADTYQSTVPRRLSGQEATSALATLRSVQFTCLFLALKVADQIHAPGLLGFMLTNSHHGAVVSLQQASDVEARCLDALGWRLGPFFIEDDLSGNDELLWAEAMGHWDYGTDRDSYPEACEYVNRCAW